MKKNLSLLLFTAVLLSACTKSNNPGNGEKVCTALFASVGVHYFDKNNNPVIVNNFTVTDRRTSQSISHVIPPNYVASNYNEVVDDNDLKKLSTEGDDLEVSATDPATGHVKVVVLKIAGGSNCHVSRVSGPDTIQFD